MSDVEKVRQSFKPEKVSILFIGESAPASGSFFYTGDSLCTLLLLTLPDRTLVKFIVRKFISYCLTERFRASNMQ